MQLQIHWMRNICLLLLFFVSAFALKGQINQMIPGALPLQIQMNKASGAITLDGVLDEDTWQQAQKNTNFSQNFPTDSVAACGETEVYFSYDEEFFYIAAKCYTPSNKFAVESLKRDYGFGANDNISFMLDTYGDKTNAFLFGMNPYGVRREALISNSGRTRDSFDPSWDNKWDGDSKRYDDHWICEMAIPFKTIRYKEGSSKWRFQSYRNDVQCNEISSFIRIPRENILMDLTFMSELNFEKPLPEPGQNISIIPFVASSVTRDFEDLDQIEAQTNFSIGGDAKISLSSSLNLDLTANPDFSQVEVDRQVTNLDRFEIFFPERRQFFLENADLFGRFGAGRVNPFFSRRIGTSQDTVTGNNIQNTIYGGARVSGKLNEKLRVGLLSMMTAPQRENDLPTFNYTVLAAEQVVFDRSNIGFIFVNKQAIDADDFGETEDRYDRVAGLEYRLSSKNNKWSGKTSFMKAITPNDTDHKFSHFTQVQYNLRKYRLEWAHLFVGNGFDAETGFVPRRDILLLSPEFDYRIFPKTQKISQITFGIDTRWIYKVGRDDNEVIQDFGLAENSVNFNTNFSFANSHRANFGIDYDQITLLDDFDPTRIQEDDIFLSAGEQFKNFLISASYSTDQRKRFFLRLEPVYGQFFGGTRYGTSGRLTYRFQPYGSISLNANYNRLDLGDNFELANLWLIGPRIDITFTKKHFLTTFLQYNNQLDNLSVNTRFQWRFAPASDFFIVYSDNFDTFNQFGSRNRGVVAKLTYWLNL